MEEAKAPKPAGKTIPAISEVLDDGTIVELIYRPLERITRFAVSKDGQCSLRESVEVAGKTLVPFSPDNNLVRHEVVLFPSQPEDYESLELLVSDVKAFIHRYVDVSPSFEEAATYYVLLTWVYDAFNEMPYLRLRGDFGTGKTRTLLTIGSLCYKAFFASGASTVSPIFHILDAFRGTLIFDEADFRFSDERAEIVKVLNNGNVRGVPVLRTMMNHQKEFNPRAFQVFGPKIAATRSNYDDKGLESRFLTEDMGSRRLRSDIPVNLPPHFQEEARQLRNKLLLYRFHHRHTVRLDDRLLDPALEPRLNQILMPLLSIIDKPEVRADVKSLAVDAFNSIAAERSLSIEAHVLHVIVLAMSKRDRAAVSVKDIAEQITQLYQSEYDRPITNRWIGSVLRNRLNLRTYKSHGNYVVPLGERSKILQLCTRFGVDTGHLGISEHDCESTKVQSGDMGTSKNL